MNTMSDKEKQIQIALGTLDIPELIPIDLNKIDGNNNTHPDIEEDEQYLVRIEGEYRVGYIEYIDGDCKEFCIGSYAQFIYDCEAIWLIKGRS